MLRVLIVGGVAGGATVAARISRLSRLAKVTLVERSPDVSFANCGLPYFLGQEIKDRNLLSLHSASSLEQALGISVLTHTEATKIDLDNKSVTTKNSSGTNLLLWDKLILSPGANPFIPKVPGIGDHRIFTLRNLQDMDKIHAELQKPSCKRVVVIGAGFIGLEMAEQLVGIGKEVALVEKGPTILPQVDEEIALMAHPLFPLSGVHLCTNDGLLEFHPSPTSLGVKLESGKILDADLVVLAIGVRPDNALISNSAIKTTERGYVPVNSFMQTSHPDVYAVGDVIETADFVFPNLRTTVALGNIANMQGRIAADHAITGKSIPYKGSLGTSIVRVFDTTLAVTGWTERRLKASKIPYQTTTITAPNHASYYPGALPITLKITFGPDGVIYGGQAIGHEGVDKRIDVLATAIQGRLTVDDLSLTQLCYSPPYGSARDVITTAALSARNIREKLVVPGYSLETHRKVIDVRAKEASTVRPIGGAIQIPYDQLADKLSELNKSEEFLTVCSLGKTSYFASRLLQQEGFNVQSLVGGLLVNEKKELPPVHTQSTPVSPTMSEPMHQNPKTQVNLDCVGLSCPGPLLKLRQALEVLPPNAALHVKASDPGFLADLPAFAKSNGYAVSDLKFERGIVSGVVEKADSTPGSAAPSSSGARKGATIVVFSCDMDKVLAAFVIANGAAAMGGQVTMFFTFWGLNALVKENHPPVKKTIIEKMFGFMMPAGINKLGLSKMNFGGLGSVMMKKEMEKKSLPNLPSLFAEAKAQKIRMVACTMSMTAMGIHKEELIDGIEFGGVADFLASAEHAGTNLFI